MKKFSATLLSLGLLSSMIALASEGDRPTPSAAEGDKLFTFAAKDFEPPQQPSAKQMGRRPSTQRRTTVRRKPRMNYKSE